MTTAHPSRDIHARIYHKLLDVIPDLMTIEESGKSIVASYMDLNLDILHRRPDRIIIALSHYYRHQSGDMIAIRTWKLRFTPSVKWLKHSPIKTAGAIAGSMVLMKPLLMSEPSAN